MTTRKDFRNKKRKTRKRCAKGKKGGGDDEVAAKKIQTFMKRPRVAERRVSSFLKNICSDSNVCIAFGIEQPKIYKFFQGYTDKKYMRLPILRIGKPSKNGFINQIEYERDGYFSHAALKTSAKRGADNVVYEYIVGTYLNKMAKFYPCLMQTYALIEYGDADTYHSMQTSNESITTPEELDNLKLRKVEGDAAAEESLLNACTHPLKYAVLTQIIKDAQSFSEIHKNGSVENTILLLHQIYFTLHCMRNHFTHYDLHMENVLCYSVGHNKYIEFMYHMNDGSIHTYEYNRLAYMIDYGRCFFHESPEHNSAEILDKLCKVPCPTPCGAGDGFINLFGNEPMYITGYKRNNSADLRLLKMAFQPRMGMGAAPIYGKIKFDGRYSTPEVLFEGFSQNRIHNVSDAFHELTRYIRMASDVFAKKFARFGFTKMGTLHIYEDGTTPMKYEPAAVAPVPPATLLMSTAIPLFPTKPTRPPTSPRPRRPPTFISTPAAANRIDTRVSTSILKAPRVNEYINSSPYPVTKISTRETRPTLIVQNPSNPGVLPPEHDEAFYNAETPK